MPSARRCPSCGDRLGERACAACDPTVQAAELLPGDAARYMAVRAEKVARGLLPMTKRRTTEAEAKQALELLASGASLNTVMARTGLGHAALFHLRRRAAGTSEADAEGDAARGP